MLNGYLWLGVMKGELNTTPSYSSLSSIYLNLSTKNCYYASWVLARKNTSPCMPSTNTLGRIFMLGFAYFAC